jgi:hypothetical protein
MLSQQSKTTSQTSNGVYSQLSAIISWCHGIGQKVSNFLLEGHEPQIRQIRGRDGVIWWQAYDPISQRSLTCASELEVRLWLDQLPYL